MLPTRGRAETRTLVTRATRARGSLVVGRLGGARLLLALGPAAGLMTQMLHVQGHVGRGKTGQRQRPTRICSGPDPAGHGRGRGTLHLVQEWRAGRCGIMTWTLVGAVRTCRSRAGRGARHRARPAPCLSRSVRDSDGEWTPVFLPSTHHMPVPLRSPASARRHSVNHV